MSLCSIYKKIVPFHVTNDINKEQQFKVTKSRKNAF